MIGLNNKAAKEAMNIVRREKSINNSILELVKISFRYKKKAYVNPKRRQAK
tara:strand:- start:393 stop:545 length:153 start_codon:yes stop_codon:yes gene_type:complete